MYFGVYIVTAQSGEIYISDKINYIAIVYKSQTITITKYETQSFQTPQASAVLLFGQKFLLNRRVSYKTACIASEKGKKRSPNTAQKTNKIANERILLP